MPKNGEIDLQNIVYNDAVINDEIDDLDNKDALHLNDGLANNNNNNNNNIKHVGVIINKTNSKIILLPPIIIHNYRTIVLEG